MATMLPELSPAAHLVPAAPLQRRVDYFATITIQADIRRILHALTIPEYIEAWLEIPGVDRISCIGDGDGAGHARFRLELYNAGKLRAKIAGRCHLMASNHLMMSWSSLVRGVAEESVVEIRIRRMRQNFLVILRHTQLQTSKKAVWNSSTWQQSLDKLRCLLEG